jgi:hypothetical protein
MKSRLVSLESENGSLEKQLQELKMHRDNWHTMATQNEEALRTVPLPSTSLTFCLPLRCLTLPCPCPEGMGV